MMLGAMTAAMGTVASSTIDVIADHDTYDPPRKRKREPRARPIHSPRQERKDKSASLQRMLKRTGRV
jgi:hypothetical protein